MVRKFIINGIEKIKGIRFVGVLFKLKNKRSNLEIQKEHSKQLVEEMVKSLNEGVVNSIKK